MSESQPNEQLSKEAAKELVDMIAEVEREEASTQNEVQESQAEADQEE